MEEDPRGVGRPSRWSYLAEGEIVRVEEDRNGDGKVDLWTAFSQGNRIRQAEDPQFVGEATIVYHFEGDRLSAWKRAPPGTPASIS